jgi:tRNA (uracil-5-)-methyltransferase
MNCSYFGECGSCKLYALSYEEQLEQKKEYIKELFENLHVKDFSCFISPTAHYRNRAEFRIWHDKEKISYAMGRMDAKGAVQIESCPKVVKSIYELMPKLKEELEQNDMLRYKLFAVEFLAATSKVLVSLLYHKPIDENWEIEAKKLEDKFAISVIGRSKKIKKVLSEDFVIDSLHVNNKQYKYKIIEGGFSQPNSFVNAQMIEWVLSHVKDTKDLLELYCGHGNFTLPLSEKFEKVLATEISKSSISSALSSCELNNISNIQFLRMSVEDLTSALNKEREFNRLKEIDLDAYTFSHVFVDPPRAGIDTKSLEFLKRFEKIIYISCNPETLKRDIEFLNYEIEDFAIFDQFPYTSHVESGALLRRKK